LRRLLLIAALCCATASVALAQSAGDFAGRWASSAGQCESEYLLLEKDGSYASTLDEEKHEGKWRAQRDRLVLTDNDEPDRPFLLQILDFSGNRLVAFDESIESDRRLTRCR